MRKDKSHKLWYMYSRKKKKLEEVEKIELTAHKLTGKEVGSLLTEYRKSLHMIGRIMHIISSGYLWRIFLCRLTFFKK